MTRRPHGFDNASSARPKPEPSALSANDGRIVGVVAGAAARLVAADVRDGASVDADPWENPPRPRAVRESLVALRALRDRARTRHVADAVRRTSDRRRARRVE